MNSCGVGFVLALMFKLLKRNRKKKEGANRVESALKRRRVAA